MIAFTLPYPPTNNRYYRNIVMGKSARVLLSSDGRKYKAVVQAEFLRRVGMMNPLQGDIAMVLDIYPPDRRKRDIDGTFKGLLDALQGLAYVDDNQIKHLNARMHPSEGKPGHVYVTLTEAG